MMMDIIIGYIVEYFDESLKPAQLLNWLYAMPEIFSERNFQMTFK